MVLAELVTQLMTDDELATSRVGILPATADAARWIGTAAAEMVVVDPSRAAATEPVCELVVADAGADTIAVLPAAIGRLTRDGILVAAVPSDLASEAARTATTLGTEWAAVLAGDTTDSRYLVAAIGLHPIELGSPVTDHLEHTPGPACVHVPQNRADRARRRNIRRHGRARLITLARRLQDQHGDAIDRVVHGIEVLVGDRRAKPNAAGARPAMFAMPGIATEPWPNPARWPRLGRLMATCERYAAEVRTELRRLVASRSPDTYLQNGYMASKFPINDPGDWRAIKLFDEGRPTAELPSDSHATRAMLTDLAPHISGEAVLLRVAPNTALPPHYDDNDYQQTAHLGITIPPDCGIRVGGEARTWQEGKPLAFSPVFLHEVWNRSNQARDVLLIDTWHMDLTDPEIEALTHVRHELTAMRKERNAQRTQEELSATER